MDSIKLIVNDEDFQKLYEEQAEAYGGVSSMASMEMDVYLNGTEEEKEADASKIRDLAMEFFDGQKEAGNLPAEREHPLIRPCLHENLSVITAGELPPNPSELIGSAQMVSLVEALKKKFEYVVLDLPPVTSVIDPVAVSPCTTSRGET